VPAPYRRIVPVPLAAWRSQLGLASGIAKLTCAALLVLPRTRRIGAFASTALLVAVFPANVQMALDGGYRDAGFPFNSSAAAWARLPLQIPLVIWALSLRRAGAPRQS